MPFTYWEAKCDRCGNLITPTDATKDYNVALTKNGQILCESCGALTPDRVIKWFTLEAGKYEKEEPEELEPSEAEIEDKIAHTEKEPEA